MRLIRSAQHLLVRAEGQTMAEVGVLLAVVALVVVLAATLLGTNLSTIFSNAAHNT